VSDFLTRPKEKAEAPKRRSARQGKQPDGAGNAIDIAIAITGFLTESSMMFSWNSAAVEQFATPLSGLAAENQLVLTARPECLRRVDLDDPDPPSANIDVSPSIRRPKPIQRNSWKVHVNLCAAHHSDF
jgi:hypothetical protein